MIGTRKTREVLMFYAPQVSLAPTGEPPRFDPMLGGAHHLRHVSSGEVRPEEVTVQRI